jgi:hypothetical protein
MPESSKRVDFSRLVDWVDGRLPEGEAQALEEQVARADSQTLADIAWLRKFMPTSEYPFGRLESPVLGRFQLCSRPPRSDRRQLF